MYQDATGKKNEHRSSVPNGKQANTFKLSSLEDAYILAASQMQPCAAVKMDKLELHLSP